MKALNFRREQISHNHLNLQDRLKVESLRRTSNGSFPQILLALLSWGFMSSVAELDIKYPIGFVLIICFQFTRFFVISRNKTNYEKLVGWFRPLMGLSFATASTWTFLASFAFYEFHLASIPGVIFLCNVVGYIAGTTYSLAPTPKLQKMYILLVSSPLFLAAIFEEGKLAWLASALFLTFVIYLFIISINHSADLIFTYQTEADLRSEREKLRLVINSVPGFVAMADQNGHWIEASNSFKNLQKHQIFIDEQNTFRQSGADFSAREIEWADESEQNSYLVSFGRLQSNFVVMVGIPINELKAVRREMELQRSKAEYSARLSTIGEMAGGIAHEINSPLAIIVHAAFGLKMILEEKIPNDKEPTEMLEKIENTAFRISSIIRSLQYFAKQGDQEPFEQTTATAIVENSLPLFQQKFADHHIEFLLGKAPNRPLLAKPMQIGQVLINLLNNAYDAVSKTAVKKIELNFSESERGLIFSVTDSGPGVPAHATNRIFEPFYSTKEVGEGTGLGLSVSKGIVEGHGGFINLRAQPDATTFEFLIPWDGPRT